MMKDEMSFNTFKKVMLIQSKHHLLMFTIYEQSSTSSPTPHASGSLTAAKILI